MRSASATLGDVELFAGDAAEAGRLYDRYLTLYRGLAAPDDVLLIQRRLGLAFYRRGVARLRQGDKPGSERDFEECLRLRELYARERPKNLSGTVELMLARARRGQHEGAANIAEQLRSLGGKGKNTNLLFQAACGFALASAAAPEPKLRDEYRAKALAAVRELIAAGYKDRDALSRDPDLDPIRDDSAFREAVATLK